MISQIMWLVYERYVNVVRTHLADNTDEKYKCTLSRDQKRYHRCLGVDRKQPHNNALKTFLKHGSNALATTKYNILNSNPEDPWLCTVLYVFLI